MGEIPSKYLAALRWIVEILEDPQIKFQITGGLAARFYGSSRSLNDIDIELHRSDIDRLHSKLSPWIEEELHHHVDPTWDLYVAVLKYDGQLIDLSAVEDAYIMNKFSGKWDAFSDGLDRVEWVEAYGLRLPLQNREDLVSYKNKIAYDEAKHLNDIHAISQGGYCTECEPIDPTCALKVSN